MEYDKELEASISQALREDERDLSLPNKSLVDETPLTKIRDGVKLKMMEVQLDQNFMQECPTTSSNIPGSLNYAKELPSKTKPSHSS